jgi:DNA polymerase-3 subunit alpha
LIDEAKLFGINICLPSLTNNFIDFTIHNGCIHFGIGNIKEVGESAVNKIKELKFELEQSLRKPIAECGWTNILIYLLCNLPKNVVIALIEAGALDFTGLSRTEMLFEYNVAYSLTIRELDLIKRFGDLDQHLSVYLDKLLLQPKIGSQRRKIIDSLQVSLVNSPHSLEDTLEWKNRAEKNRLGHIISSLDVSNKRGSEQANVTCLEFLQNNAYNQNLIFAVKIVKYKEYTSKKGNYMVFVTIKDETGQIDGIIFEKLWQKVKDENIIVEDNDVLVFGYRSPKNPKTVVVTQLVQLI